MIGGALRITPQSTIRSFGFDPHVDAAVLGTYLQRPIDGHRGRTSLCSMSALTTKLIVNFVTCAAPHAVKSRSEPLPPLRISPGRGFLSRTPSTSRERVRNQYVMRVI
jgi:hypothetical protein